jgi:hypothetical protein
MCVLLVWKEEREREANFIFLKGLLNQTQKHKNNQTNTHTQERAIMQ